jgi:hypothetical protein
MPLAMPSLVGPPVLVDSGATRRRRVPRGLTNKIGGA